MNLILALLVVILLVLLIRAILVRAPRYGRPVLIRLGILVLALVLFGLAISGRLHWLFAILSGLLPFLGRILQAFAPLLIRLFPLYQQQRRQRRAAGPKTAGQRSQVDSRRLQMTLDHDSGAISGVVLIGEFAGRTLESLTLQELQRLYASCQQDDPEGIRLLDAYIQRHRQEWSAEESQDEGSSGSGSGRDNRSETMTAEEALAILGLESGATNEQIIQAHKRMMARMHPDKGGSNYLAAKINQAKELLLKGSSSRG